jgi:hypothetical protein
MLLLTLAEWKLQNDSVDAVTQWMVWNLQVLEGGVHPLCNHSGEPWPADSRQYVVESVADSSYL